MELLTHEGIDALVLKGAALSHLVYKEVGLRPMRDVDLLVRPSEANAAQELLLNNGYYTATVAMPEDHFHLAPLTKIVKGFKVCIEIHRRLFPVIPPYYIEKSFDKYLMHSVSFNIDNTPARTIGYEDLLYHLFQHGFRAPLRFEPYRLISVADIIGLVEAKLNAIDWDKIRTEYPKLINALPHFHHLTPWQNAVLDRLNIRPGSRPRNVGRPFDGWPRFQLSEFGDKRLLEIVRDTLIPPEWWFRMYYCTRNRLDWCRYRFLQHPKHLWWWVRLYGARFRAHHLKVEGEVEIDLDKGLLRLIWRAKVVIVALLRQLFRSR